MADLQTILARAIRAERGRLILNQADLADRLGWDRSIITKIEGGRRDIAAQELPALCRALEVTLDQLLRDADPGDREALGLD